MKSLKVKMIEVMIQREIIIQPKTVRGILANFYLIPSKIIVARGRCKWKLLPHGKQKYRHVYVKVNADITI